MPTSQSAYLTETQVAELLGVTKKAISNWRYQRKALPFVKVAGVVRYPREALEKYLASQTFSPTAQKVTG